jgi:phospholipase C
MSRFAVAVSTLLVASTVCAAPLAKTPIRHLVVIFQENHSFDAYFATYPQARNPAGSRRSMRAGHAVGQRADADFDRAQSQRLEAVSHRPPASYTCDQDHEYTAEQKARNGGLMDQFVRFDAQPPFNERQSCHKSASGAWDTVMATSTAIR